MARSSTRARLVVELDAVARLHKLTTLSLSEAPLEQILGDIVDVAIALSGADFGHIQLIDPASSDLRIVAQRGFPKWWIDFWNKAAKDQGACGAALGRGERVIVEDVEKSPIFAGAHALSVQLKAGVRAVQSTPLISWSGQPIGMFSTHYKRPHRPTEHSLKLLDLLARRAADAIVHAQGTAALRESEERFRLAMSNVASGLYTLDPQGLVTYMNPAAEAMFGWTNAELLGKKMHDVTHYKHPDGTPFPAKDCPGLQILEKGIELREHEDTFIRKDGTFFTVVFSASPLKKDGATVGIVVGFRDDTVRRQAERSVRESEERFRLMANAAPVLIWMSGIDKLCTYFNQGWLEFTGRTLQQEMGNGWAEGVHADDLKGCLDIYTEAFDRREPFRMEYRLRRHDGQYRWILDTGIPRFNGNGSFAGYIGACIDITEVKQAEEESAQARLKDEFLAFLGHELRNPLAAISSAMEALSTDMSATQRASLDELIRRQVKVLRRLVDDLLDISRIAHGQIRLQKESINLADLLQTSAAEAQSAVAGREQKMVVRLPRGHVLFMADGVRMKQIAANLLDNASKYTGRGGRIELSGAREGSEVVIRCKDNGRGIPQEMHGKIFEPLTRVEMPDADAEVGLGLGLALVKRLAELHGGTVSVESGGAGAGSEFTVRLPLVAAPAEPRVAVKTEPAPLLRPALSIVLVEDNLDVGRILEATLEKAGHRVNRFVDGPSALSGVVDLKPDAILLDIGLPGMDGYEVAAKMKQKTNVLGALFIGLSGFTRREPGEKAGDVFDHYFVKPVDSAELLALLETYARPGVATEPLRVLLVEDNADLAKATERLLRLEGAEVRTALTGREALEAALDFPPQLTLCDFYLPDMDGPEVVQALRSNSATPRTHAVIVTGRSEAEIDMLKRKAKQTGVDEYITKPLTRDAIRGLLSRVASLERMAPKRQTASEVTSSRRRDPTRRVG